MKRKIADSLLIASLFIFFVLGIGLIVYPIVTPYSFVTVSKNSNIYDEPIKFTFHWKTEDELQVGKPIILWIEIQGLPYSESNPPSKNIEILFNENELNYYKIDDSLDGKFYSVIDKIKFRSEWDKNIFTSDKFGIRFIIPTDVSVEFCDYNLKGECSLIENVIHPAPHDLALRIENNRIGIGVSLVVAAFSSLVIWSILRPKHNSS